MTGPINPPTAADYERSARHSLEKKVSDLERRVQQLEERFEKRFPLALERMREAYDRRLLESHDD